jgi:hypothetical protein
MIDAMRSEFSRAVLLAGTLICSGAADAALFQFSFDNEDGALAGTASGSITLPDGDGYFPASAVVVDSGPAGLGLGFPVYFLDSVYENSFTVVSGAIDLANSHFLGLNGNTSLALNTSFFPTQQTWLSAKDVLDQGATGVADYDSSTLSYSGSSSEAPVPPTATLLALGLLGVARGRRCRHWRRPFDAA